MSQTPIGESQLTTAERSWACVIAVASLAVGLWLSLSPGTDTTVVRDGADAVISSTSSPRETTELSMIFVASAILLVAWAINGLRLIRIAVGSVSAESTPREVAAAERAAAETAPQAVDVAEEKETEPEPDVPAKGKVFIQNETEFVYPLEAVPRFVFEDLFALWPSGLQKPSSFADFEFASRRKGKGNFPWLVKFRGLPTVRVSYGGQSKPGATVAPARNN